LSAQTAIDVRALHTTDFDLMGEDPRSPQVQEVIRALAAMIVARARPICDGDLRFGTVRLAPGPARIAICVLPFANMSGDPEQEY